MVEMVVDSIRVSMMHQQRAVFLKEKTQDRFLPIWIGAFEADAIAIKLQNVQVVRPLTHDLLESVISTLGASVRRILVTELTDNTFYAQVELQAGDRTHSIDSRPSDAIALAVRVGAPIFVAEEVLREAGVWGDESKQSETAEQEQGERLDVFRDFINSLELDEPEKGEGKGDK